MALSRDKPLTLLFDLGGVIVPWVGLDALATLNDIPREEVVERFAASVISSAFERGQASEAAFIAEFQQMFDLPDTDIAALWNSWVHPPYPGVLEALADLKTQFTTACLSNTNSLHWTHLNKIFSLDETFHFAFASHLIHEAKPDASCYLKALDLMNCAAEDVWFFDDTEANIAAAQTLGLKAFHVDRSVGVLPLLQDLGLQDLGLTKNGPHAS